MPVQYTNVSEVQGGQRVASSQWNQLAQAFRDRLKNGVADCTYRLHWYIHSIVRAFRIPNGLLFAAEDEWWKIYSKISPGAYDYPTIAADLPEGISKNNPLGTFVFGNPRLNLESEPERLNYDAGTNEGVLLHNPLAPETDLEKWEVGKFQRGVTDVDCENLGQSNAINAAKHHLRIKGAGFIHKGYGGFLPSPGILGYCADADVDGELSYNLKFTNLNDSTESTYATCRGSSGNGTAPNTSKSVYNWGQNSDSYLLYHHDGTTTELPFSDYVEGPYTGAADNAWLNRLDGDQLQRATNFYQNDFRGDSTERHEEGHRSDDTAFEFQRFYNRQYFLAPAFGVQSGYGEGSLDCIYPQFDFPEGTPAGTKGTVLGDTQYTIHSGFVFAGVIAVGTNLSESKTFTIYVNGEQYYKLILPAGAEPDRSQWFEFPNASGTVVEIVNDQAINAGEEAYCEIAEIMQMKPQNQDGYLVTRLGSANNSNDDGDGTDTNFPRDISDSYFRHGMIVNGLTDSAREETTYINRNPVYETVRKMANDRLRFMERVNLKGYEVTGGKSVFYFERKARGLSDVDAWEGIGPSLDEIDSGKIKHNVEYIVDSGTTGITYNDITYFPGDTFTGLEGKTTFTKENGDEIVKEYDGIINTAGINGTDNMWTMFLTQIGYQPSDQSAYKPDGYGDVLGWGHDRCVTFSDEWSKPSFNPDSAEEINRHVAVGGGFDLIRSENPSGYRYLLGTHSPPLGSSSATLIEQENDAACVSTESVDDCEGAVNYYRSCQVYVPDYEIESVIMEGSDQVKVTLTGRLRNNDSAPASVSNNSASWDTYDSTEEGPRTDENSIIDYLRWSLGSGDNCIQRIGDWSPQTPASTTSIIKGACMPRFYLTRQIPKVYEDGNNTPDAEDTRLWDDEMLWLDLVLRAVCEGYIDENSSNDLREVYYNEFTLKNECREKRLFDYTYENLMLQANSNRWPRLLPKGIRSDNPKMFGPLPQVDAFAEHFNQIARAVNLLTRARLYLPVNLYYRNVNYLATTPVEVETRNEPPNCNSGAVWAEDVDPPTGYNFTGYGSDDIFDGKSDATIIAIKDCDISEDGDGNCVIECTRQDVEYRLELSELAQEALPDDLKTLVVDNNGGGFLVTIDNIDEYKAREITDEAGSWTGNSSNKDDYKDSQGQYQDWVDVKTEPTTCEIADSGTLVADDPERSDYIDAKGGGSAEGSKSTKNLTLYQGFQAYVKVPLV